MSTIGSMTHGSPYSAEHQLWNILESWSKEQTWTKSVVWYRNIIVYDNFIKYWNPVTVRYCELYSSDPQFFSKLHDYLEDNYKYCFYIANRY